MSNRINIDSYRNSEYRRQGFDFCKDQAGFENSASYGYGSSKYTYSKENKSENSRHSQSYRFYDKYKYVEKATLSPQSRPPLEPIPLTRPSFHQKGEVVRAPSTRDILNEGKLIKLFNEAPIYRSQNCQWNWSNLCKTYLVPNIHQYSTKTISVALFNLANKCKTLEPHEKIRLIKKYKPIIEIFKKKILSDKTKLSGRSIATITRAFASLNIKAPSLFNGLIEEAILQLDSMNALALNDLAFAYSHFKIQNEKLFDALAREAILKLSTFNLSLLSKLTASFSRAKIKDVELLKTLRERAVKCIQDKTSTEEITLQEISGIAKTFATVRFKDKELFSSLAGRTILLVDKVTGSRKNLIDIAWAFAIAGEGNNKRITVCLLNELEGMASHINSAKELTQLKHVLLASGLSADDQKLFFPKLLKKIDGLKEYQEKNPAVSSELHKMLMRSFDRIGIVYKSEVPQDGFSFDMLFRADDGHLAVGEVNGPGHYLSNGEMDGTTWFKIEILTDVLKYDLVLFSYKDLDRFKPDSDALDAFVIETLEKHGIKTSPKESQKP
jgi:hypothetical protein